ncbi:serine--tRNA ligase [bacterium]|nr:serine--tRNA ligase [bacterium]
MLDIKFIRENLGIVKQAVSNKNSNVDLKRLLTLDSTKRALQTETDQLKKQRNEVSKQIGLMKKDRKPCDDLMTQMRETGEKIKNIDRTLREIRIEMDEILVWIPNIPHKSAPVGKGEEHNKFVRDYGEKPSFDFEPKDHVELATELEIIDFEASSRLSGSGFILFKNQGALLERALINFMIDLHTIEHGYTEISPPFIVSSACMFGTGQLPKMEEDMYKVKDEDLYLIPTAEVPVTNIFRTKILEEDDLPKQFVAYTPCFRREAGSYGKDTRGMTRVHQFDKVELVKLVKEAMAYSELEKLLINAERVLQLLEIPYRVIELCTGDMSFAATKCYDIEAWSPGTNSYLEVSSCSTFENFQARRMGLRYREKSSRKVKLVNTMNGSGLALPRTVIAVIENYQMEDGRVRIPQVLKPYMRNLNYIQK